MNPRIITVQVFSHTNTDACVRIYTIVRNIINIYIYIYIYMLNIDVKRSNPIMYI